MAPRDPDYRPRSRRRSEHAPVRRGRAPFGVEALESRVLLSLTEIGSIGSRIVLPITPSEVAENPPSIDIVPRPTPGVEVDARMTTPPPQWTVFSSELKPATLPRVVEGEHLLPPPLTEVRQLPDLPRFELSGRLTPQAPVELYHVPIHPGTRSVRVEMTIPALADPEVYEHLWLLVEAGSLLGHWSLPEPGVGWSVVLNPTDPFDTTDSDLFVGITRESMNNDPSQIAPPAPFVLSIGLDDGTISTPSPQSTRPESTPAAPGTSWWNTIPELGTTDPARSTTSLTDEPSSSRLGQEFSGTLPMRSAGPSAGVVTDGHSIPPVGPLDGAIVDLTLIDVTSELVPLSPSEPLAIEGLAATRSPGGFPLLASVGSMGVFPDPGSTLFVTRTPPSRGTETRSPDRREAIKPQDEDRSHPRPTIAITLGLAAAVTFGLLLPDLTTWLTPASPRRPLPWTRRPHAGEEQNPVGGL